MVFDGDRRRCSAKKPMSRPESPPVKQPAAAQPPPSGAMSRRQIQESIHPVLGVQMVAVGVSNELIGRFGGILQARHAILVAYSERCLFPEPFLAGSATARPATSSSWRPCGTTTRKPPRSGCSPASRTSRAGAARCTTAGSRSGGASRRHVGRSAARRSPSKAARRLPHYQRPEPRSYRLSCRPSARPAMLSLEKDVPDRPPPVVALWMGHVFDVNAAAGGDGWPGCGALAPAGRSRTSSSAFGDRLDLDWAGDRAGSVAGGLDGARQGADRLANSPGDGGEADRQTIRRMLAFIEEWSATNNADR